MVTLYNCVGLDINVAFYSVPCLESACSIKYSIHTIDCMFICCVLCKFCTDDDLSSEEGDHSKEYLTSDTK